MKNTVWSIILLFFIIQIVFLPYAITSTASTVYGESRSSMLLASAAASQPLASARARYTENSVKTFGTPIPACCGTSDSENAIFFLSNSAQKPSDKEHSLAMLVVSRK